jgi:DNA-binding CsgD family transcriptional regulator
MVGVCSVCVHAEREAIDRAILDGESNRQIADRFGVGRMMVQRHKPHIAGALVQAQEVKEVARADTLLDQVQDLNRRALAILARAEEGGDVRECCAAIRECRGVLELLAKVAGQIPPENQTNVLINLDPAALRSLGDWMASHA